ncbi:hypothetical protein T484DRAFT_1860842 [Baffinella frigidus]|nr:hypothetical protein T484DRAFT_1860842 [Cryptophyta sp. CCMP2293]
MAGTRGEPDKPERSENPHDDDTPRAGAKKPGGDDDEEPCAGAKKPGGDDDEEVDPKPFLNPGELYK